MDLGTFRIIKFLGAIVAVAAAVYSLSVHDAPASRKKAILLFWLIGPPTFFYLEYFFQAPLLSGDDLTQFKDLQSSAGKVWAGIAAALGLMYFKGK